MVKHGQRLYDDVATKEHKCQKGVCRERSISARLDLSVWLSALMSLMTTNCAIYIAPEKLRRKRAEELAVWGQGLRQKRKR